MKVVMWFSAGVSSAVACKLGLQKYPDMEIVYIDIDNHHPDNLRFISECETWFGKKITVLKSPYSSIENVINTFKYVNGPAGARCTQVLKRRVRQEWEIINKPDLYLWGFDCSKREKLRAQRTIDSMEDFKHEFPLIENNMTKELAHGYLAKTGILRPAMYELGYPNNNCIGCVKGGKGYWNKIRVDFPDVFDKMAKLERIINRTCINGCFLDELDPEAGRKDIAIEVEDCGILCQLNKEDEK